jgi:hypothetical protein
MNWLAGDAMTRVKKQMYITVIEITDADAAVKRQDI